MVRMFAIDLTHPSVRIHGCAVNLHYSSAGYIAISRPHWADHRHPNFLWNWFEFLSFDTSVMYNTTPNNRYCRCCFVVTRDPPSIFARTKWQRVFWTPRAASSSLQFVLRFQKVLELVGSYSKLQYCIVLIRTSNARSFSVVAVPLDVLFFGDLAVFVFVLRALVYLDQLSCILFRISPY